jgi:hypothetical protein
MAFRGVRNKLFVEDPNNSASNGARRFVSNRAKRQGHVLENVRHDGISPLLAPQG